jgi:methylenetetrahydrofolate dehydrogenase (NADP+)/methenyltetrahydrofolate cyclohydrolase/formyltetrahydrofolate synthetase
LYDLEVGIEKKIETIAREIYGAAGIELSEEARVKVERYTRQVRGFRCSACYPFSTQSSARNHP